MDTDPKKIVVKKPGGKSPVIINPPEKRLTGGYNEAFETSLQKHTSVCETRTKIILQAKAAKFDIPEQVASKVFVRGLKAFPSTSLLTREQYAMDHVNSFINGGAAMEKEWDLIPIQIDERLHTRMGTKGTGGAGRAHIKREKSPYNGKMIYHVVDKRGVIKHSTQDEMQAKQHLASKYRSYMESTSDRSFIVIDEARASKLIKEEPKQIDELSNKKLADYKKKAGVDASAADKSGNYAKGNKRFSGIMKATKKQFANDTKQGVAEEGYGNHPSQRVDPRTGKKYVPPKSPLGQGVAEGTYQLAELKKSTVKSYASKKQAEIDDVPPLPFKKPVPSNAEHEKNAKGMMGALARLSGKKPTSESIMDMGAGLGAGRSQGVAEGNSGAKYKVKIIGRDKNGDYYISPSTGKKVYKSGVKRGDHENPKTGEHKGVAESLDQEFNKVAATKNANSKPELINMLHLKMQRKLKITDND